MAGHPIPEKNRSTVDLHGAATKPFDARIFEIHSPDCDSENLKLDRNSELRRFDTDTNEIGGSNSSRQWHALAAAADLKQLVVQRECTSACWFQTAENSI